MLVGYSGEDRGARMPSAWPRILSDSTVSVEDARIQEAPFEK